MHHRYRLRIHKNQQTFPVLLLKNYYIFRFYGIYVIHFFEALYAGYLASSLRMDASYTARWFLQTFCFGFPSTRLIRNHYKSVESKSN